LSVTFPADGGVLFALIVVAPEGHKQPPVYVFGTTHAPPGSIS
jgi:hypothetical protein